MSSTALAFIFLGAVVVAVVVKFAWAGSAARRQPSRSYTGQDDLDWDAVQHHRDSQDGGWDSSHHSDSWHSSSHGDSSHSDSGVDSGGGGDGGGGGGDSSSD